MYRLAISLFLVLCLACNQAPETPPEPTGPDAAAIAANNKGVAEMGRFEYKQAAETFGALLATYPEWLPVKVNLGIATLNLQTENSEAEALRLFGEVLEKEPDNQRALYCTGLLRVYLGEDEAATTYFKKVMELDPRDAHATYYYGQCLSKAGKHEEALRYYEKAAELDPYLRSAWYGQFQAYQRMRKRDEARTAMTQFQKLKDNPQARQVEFKYTRMGRKAEVKVVDDLAQTPVVVQGPVYGESTALPLPEGMAWALPERTAMTVVDLEGDGDLDLVAAQSWQGETLANAVYEMREGGFVARGSHVLSRIEKANAFLWGDVDNDGMTDVYVLRDGANQLWRQVSKGDWLQVNKPELAVGDYNSVAGAMIDADHDGDLDLFVVNANGPNELLNNNLNGSWRPLAEAQGLQGSGKAKGVISADFDNDRDLDILVINEAAPHDYYENHLLWEYKRRDVPGLTDAPLDAAIAGDANADGDVEIYASAGDTLSIWTRKEDGSWDKGESWTGILPNGTLAWTDLQGSGRTGVHAVTSNGLQAMFPGSLGFGDRNEAAVATVAASVAKDWQWMASPDGSGPRLLEQSKDGISMREHKAKTGFLNLSLRGALTEDASMRSNLSGIGTRWALRSGSSWTAGATWTTSWQAGQSLQPAVVGLAGQKRADFIALTWPDGVFQTELNLEAGNQTIGETQRQLASCPVLFVDNGEGYQFVSDVLGVAGIGFNVGKGQYATPRPDEAFLIPQEALVAVNGRYRLKLAEPMEESAYLDHLALDVYDVPEDWQMVIDERMGISEPLPTGKPVFYKNEWLPVEAHNDRGEDIRELLLNVDSKAGDPGKVDKRFLGLLEKEYSVELDFGQALKGSNLWLVMDGWVEYPYSQTCFAAWQAGRAYEAPSLDIAGTDGRWQVHYKNFGYPAGMPRRMAVPLGKLPGDARKLRLRTNQEIYWDRISLVAEEDLASVVHRRREVIRANLAAEGFARRDTLDQKRPHYDDSDRQPLWDTRHQMGRYTAFGDVLDLVGKKDDALCILGPGEAVSFDFEALPEAEGKRRYGVLRMRGWCKDMDLYTRDGETIAPLPGEDTEARRVLHERYNTRDAGGY